jgi:hypothetical protein
MNSTDFQNHLKESYNIDVKDIYNSAGVEYNEGYTLDTFEKEFNEAQSEKAKKDVFTKLLDSNIDFSVSENIERMVEYHAQLQDYRQELQIEVDYLINIELEMFPGKWQLYTCIKDVNVCTTGHNYYVKIDDIAKQYQDAEGEIPESIAEYVNTIKPLIWIVTDNGIGTLKSKNLFIEDVYGKFGEHFTKYEN